MNRRTENRRLFDIGDRQNDKKPKTNEQLKRLDLDGHLRKKILPLCRLRHGQIWEDEVRGHRVGLLDATSKDNVVGLVGSDKAQLALNDPPYNVVVGNANTKHLSKIGVTSYISFSEKWISNVIRILDDNSHFYIWMGADYKDNFQPLPQFIILMGKFHELKTRNLITMRNQRGYGTQKNWMWVRQELLYYVKGKPDFNVEAEYTDIPKTLRGYYKQVNGRLTENLERSRSQFIRAGNVWLDIQQVFYRLEENVPGCYAQKPLKATERIVLASTSVDELVVDLFSHAGTTLVAGERLRRKVYTMDIDPIFAEITIRRLENLRKTGRTGWQWNSPFPEIENTEGPGKWI